MDIHELLRKVIGIRELPKCFNCFKKNYFRRFEKIYFKERSKKINIKFKRLLILNVYIKFSEKSNSFICNILLGISSKVVLSCSS